MLEKDDGMGDITSYFTQIQHSLNMILVMTTHVRPVYQFCAHKSFTKSLKKSIDFFYGRGCSLQVFLVQCAQKASPNKRFLKEWPLLSSLSNAIIDATQKQINGRFFSDEDC
jgi:hypothetical protein